MRRRRVAVGSSMLLTASTLLVLALGLLVPSVAGATVEFSDQTGRDCGYCHVTPGGALTPEGEAFAEAGSQLPTTTSAGPAGTVTTESGGSGGDGTGSSTLLSLPDWLYSLLLFAHLTAMVAWLGAIMFVHIVQTPRIAGRGIPSGYLKLAWPSIIVLGLSGVVLTLGAVTSLSTLIDTRWGNVLLAKIVIFLLLSSVATFVTFFVNPRLKRLAETAAGHPVGPHGHGPDEGKITFSYEGRVYDVSASKLWREGRHARRHDAWQDLTAAMAGAPHGLEVLDRFPVIEGGAEQRTPRPVRFFIALAYANLGLVLLALFVVAIW